MWDGDTLAFAEWRSYTNPRTKKTGWISEGGQVRYDDPRKAAAEKAGRRADSDTAVAQAVANPAALQAHHVEALAKHLDTLPRDRLRDVARQLRVKVGGLKAHLADRLMAYVQGHRAAAAAHVGKGSDQPRADVDESGIPAEPKRGKVYNVDPAALNVDPERFQFKLGTNAQGVTKELHGVKTFNPDFAGVISVWKDPTDGNTYVINGHHRTDLAKRSGAEELSVRYITAKDAVHARAIGALINIAEGRGTAVDAAKFMRDTGTSAADLQTHGVSMQGKLAADASTLTALSDKLFDRVARGTLDVPTAMAIAANLPDHDGQEALMRLADKRAEKKKPIPLNVLEEMAKEMRDTPKVTSKEDSLFGEIENEESLFVPRNEVKSYVRNQLAQEIGDFAAVSSTRRAGRVAGAGNVLNTEENAARAEEAEKVKNLYDQLVNRKGPISDALNEAAAEYHGAKTKKAKDAAKRKAVDAAKAAVQAEFDAIGGTGAKPKPKAEPPPTPDPKPAAPKPPPDRATSIKDLASALEAGRVAGGSADVRGDKGKIQPAKLESVLPKLVAYVNTHAAETSVGPSVDKLYAAVGEPAGLSPEEFRGAILHAEDRGVLDGSAMNGSVSSHPRPDLIPVRGRTMIGFVHPGGGI